MAKYSAQHQGARAGTCWRQLDLLVTQSAGTARLQTGSEHVNLPESAMQDSDRSLLIYYETTLGCFRMTAHPTPLIVLE